MKKILVLNCGSSSIKYALYDMTDKSVITSGGIEKIGLPDSFITVKLNGEKHKMEKPIKEHTAGVQWIFDVLTTGDYAVLKSLDELDAVGHRMVHGGEKFNQSVLLTPEVMEAFAACNDLAPLHNPANIKGVNAVSAILPNIPQVGVFDTAFHQTMPPKAYMYGVPYDYYERLHVRRYGFHGTSHRFVSRHAAEFMGKKPEEVKMITCHLGNGSSLAAVAYGKCVDTSMGITPLEGMIMGTRSGVMDPAVVQYICNNDHISVDEMLNICNKKSGLLGISGLSNDMRDIEKATFVDNNPRAKLAWDMLIYEITKYIGSYIAGMNGVDAIVFTGGIGENTNRLRQQVIDGLSWMGIAIDHAKNDAMKPGHAEDTDLTAEGSRVKILVIPTNEEIAIARDTLELVTK